MEKHKEVSQTPDVTDVRKRKRKREEREVVSGKKVVRKTENREGGRWGRREREREKGKEREGGRDRRIGLSCGVLLSC